MILSSNAALERWTALRLERQAGNSTPERRERLSEALREFSFELLWPFRIGLSNSQPPMFYLFLNNGGQGNYEEIWHMNGYHRERDIIRLAVRFRNIYYSGHAHFEANQTYDGLEYCMDNVQSLMTGYVEPETE